MMRVLVLIGALAALAACGVDGAPERPKDDGPVSISVTGTASVGVTGGSAG